MRRVVLIVAGLGGVIGLAVTFWPRRPEPPPAPDGPRLVWVFEAPLPGSVVATPCVTAEAVFLAAAHARGFHQGGAVYALDPSTGKAKWAFDRDARMLPTASSPLVAA